MRRRHIFNAQDMVDWEDRIAAANGGASINLGGLVRTANDRFREHVGSQTGFDLAPFSTGNTFPYDAAMGWSNAAALAIMRCPYFFDIPTASVAGGTWDHTAGTTNFNGSELGINGCQGTNVSVSDGKAFDTREYMFDYYGGFSYGSMYAYAYTNANASAVEIGQIPSSGVFHDLVCHNSNLKIHRLTNSNGARITEATDFPGLYIGYSNSTGAFGTKYLRRISSTFDIQLGAEATLGNPPAVQSCYAMGRNNGVVPANFTPCNKLVSFIGISYNIDQLADVQAAFTSIQWYREQIGGGFL